MELKDVTAFLEQNADKDEVKGFIKNTFYSPEKLTPILDSEEGLKLLQPRLDKYHTKGLESWKEKNLNSIIEQEIAKRNPAETEEQKRLKRIEDELNEQKRIAQTEKIKNTAITKLNENKLPLGLADILIADNEETFNSRFETVKKIWDKELNERIKDEIKKNGRSVHKDPDKKFGSTEMNSIIRSSAGIKVD